MELSENQTDTASLAALAADVVQLLRAGKFDVLAASYGYALAYGREVSYAIQEDLSACLTELGTSLSPQTDIPPIASVKYFKPDAHPLFAVAECVLSTAASGKVLLELVVTSKGTQKHVCIEQLSAVV